MGMTLTRNGWQDGRIQLTGLAADNTLVVDGRMAYAATARDCTDTSTPRTSRPTCTRCRSWTPAPRWFACFDQPDLKAGYELRVGAPARWTVIGNGPSHGRPDAG